MSPYVYANVGRSHTLEALLIVCRLVDVHGSSGDLSWVSLGPDSPEDSVLEIVQDNLHVVKTGYMMAF